MTAATEPVSVSQTAILWVASQNDLKIQLRLLFNYFDINETLKKMLCNQIIACL